MLPPVAYLFDYMSERDRFYGSKNMKLHFLMWVFALGLIAIDAVRAEEEPNEMPYEFLYELSQLAAANTQFVLTVKSKREDGSWVAMNEIEERFKAALAMEREKAQAQ
jgi:hypothetical protein